MNKLHYTFLILIFSSVFTTLITKNYLDVIAVPLALGVVSLFFSLISLLFPSRRNKEEFHRQFNYSYTLLFIFSVALYFLNS